MNPFAAIYVFWLGIPVPMREQMKSIFVAYELGLSTALAPSLLNAWTDGSLATPALTAHWLALHWWTELIGFVVGGGAGAAWRAAQARAKIANTITLPTGQTAVLAPPKDVI